MALYHNICFGQHTVSGRRALCGPDLPEFFSSPGQTGLYRIFFHVEKLCDLADLEAFSIIEKKDRAVFFVERAHQFLEFTVFQFHTDLSLLREFLDRMFPSVFADDIDAFIDRDADQPGPEVFRICQMRYGPVTSLDRILKRIRDIFLVLKITPGHFVHALLVPFNQFDECLGIPFLGFDDKVFQRDPLLSL